MFGQTYARYDGAHFCGCGGCICVGRFGLWYLVLVGLDVRLVADVDVDEE